MYCIKCKTALGVDQVYCPKCGSKGVQTLGLFFIARPAVLWPLGVAVVLLLLGTFVYPSMSVDVLKIGVFIAFLAGAEQSVSRFRFRARMRDEAKIREAEAAYKIGQRVRVKGFGGTVKPEDTGYSEPIIFDDVEPIVGTVLKTGFVIQVRWDAGEYRVFRDLVRNAVGDNIALDKGRVRLNAFESSIHPDYLSPANA